MTNKSGFFGIREIYASFILVATMIFVSIFSSMAVFQKTVEKVGVASLVANNVNQVLSSTESSFVLSTDKTYGTILVSSGSSKFFDITITNDKNINTKYKLYYRFTSGVTVLDVEVGVSDQSLNSSSASLNKSGNDGNSKVVRVGIRNTSNQDVSIDIGSQGGYENNEVILLSGRNEMGTILESYKDSSGANSPKLASGMIPVIYDSDNDKWLKADVTSEWYDYDNQWWANAVTVTSDTRSTYQSASPLTEISMDDINTMWVWIPRYKYKIPCDIGSSSSIASPPEIDVIFENGVDTTGEELADCPITSTSCYYTHPAFRDGSSVYKTIAYDQGGWDKELEGIWVGKFEMGGNNTTPIIKPNEITLKIQDVSTQFDTSLKFAGGSRNTSNGAITFSGNNIYGLTSSTDTHMMKNTEWGAVAYLSQSKYGKMGNSNYSGTDKEIYKNNSSTYTGRSSGSPNGSANIYSYNDTICSDTSCDGSKVLNKGTGASTTGTIYGIYDMHGGANEYIMSNWENDVNISGFDTNNLPGGSNGSKYYEKYTGSNSSIDVNNAIKGDATYEVNNWYFDYKIDSVIISWINRGSGYDDSDGGIFAYGSYDGYSGINSTHVVLIP